MTSVREGSQEAGREGEGEREGEGIKVKPIDQTDFLIVLIFFKATVETKATLHRCYAVTLTLG